MNIKQSLEKFKKLPLEYTLTIDSDWVASAMNKINKKYEIDISYLVIMVSVGDLPADKVVNFLISEFKININQARIISDEINKDIFNPLRKRIDFINANPQKTILISKEKQIILEIFEKKLVQEIKNNVIIIEAVNQRIFYCLTGDLNFKSEIEKVMHKNQERITGNKIIIDKDEVIPSVDNWIKYFIKDSGTDIFDNIVLSKFISNSRYASVLPDNEKNLLIKVLKTYRNIKFFPESMPNDDVDGMSGWAIIPVEQQEIKIKNNDFASKEREEKKSDFKHKHVAKKNPVLKKEKALNPEELIIEEYKKEIEKYAIGSIERKAIEQEMKNININS